MYKRKFLLILVILVINGCVSSNNKLNTISLATIKSSEIYDNYVLREHLNRIFQSETNNPKTYLLKASIGFGTKETLTTSNFSSLYLNKTIATLSYELYDIKTNKILISGYLKSSPAIESINTSLFSNDINVKHVKERLNKNLALKLSRHLSLFLSKLK